MSPRRPMTRRHARELSEAASAATAASVASSDNESRTDTIMDEKPKKVVKPTKPMTKTKTGRVTKPRAQKTEWSPHHAIEQIISREMKSLEPLTKSALAAIVVGMRDQIIELREDKREENRELQKKYDALSVENKNLRAGRRSLREATLYESIEKGMEEELQRQQKRKEVEAAVSSRIPPPPTASAPLLPPAPTPPTAPTQTPTTELSAQQAQPIYKKLLSAVSNLSPWRRSVDSTSASASPAQPLGELPASRKRTASTTEGNSTPKRLKTPSEKPYAGPSTKFGPRMPTSLDTITEYSEYSERSIYVPTTTPSRPSKRKMDFTPEKPAEEPEYQHSIPKATPKHTPKRRTIKEARAAREAFHAAQVTPYAWESNQKPKEPNADKRLALMRQMEHLKATKEKTEKELARLAEEHEAEGMRMRKRVKRNVDSLVVIPHNRPGDCEGTFRAPDIDSDDEMEVYEDEPMNDNIFERSATKSASKQATISPNMAQKTPKAVQPSQQTNEQPPWTVMSRFSTPAQSQPTFPSVHTETPAQPQPTFPSVQETPAQSQPSFPSVNTETTVTAAPITFNFPSVGLKQDDEPELTAQEKVAYANLFAFGYQQWLATGEVLKAPSA